MRLLVRSPNGSSRSRTCHTRDNKGSDSRTAVSVRVVELRFCPSAPLVRLFVRLFVRVVSVRAVCENLPPSWRHSACALRETQTAGLSHANQDLTPQTRLRFGMCVVALRGRSTLRLSFFLIDVISTAPAAHFILYASSCRLDRFMIQTLCLFPLQFIVHNS